MSRKCLDESGSDGESVWEVSRKCLVPEVLDVSLGFLFLEVSGKCLGSV